MTPQTKRLLFWIFFGFTLAIGIPVNCAVALAIPGIAFYKMKHGTEGWICYTIFASYILIWTAFIALHFRFRKRDKLWAILFGICFYALLFLCWRL